MLAALPASVFVPPSCILTAITTCTVIEEELMAKFD